MTITPERRTLLPLAGPHGSRSWATCHYRCGNACDQPEPNTSGNEHVSSVISAASTAARCSPARPPSAPAPGRRRAGRPGRRGAPVGAGTAGGTAGAARCRPPTRGPRSRPTRRHRDRAGRLPDQPGRGVGRPGAARRARVRPARPDARSRGEAVRLQQRLRLPAPAGRPPARLLVVNHEYTNEKLMFPGYGAGDTATASRSGSRWPRTACPWSRSSGPGHAARGSRSDRAPRVQPARHRAPPSSTHRPGRRARPAADLRRPAPAARSLGTLNNCAGGTTPWGTMLSGEENFNQYFANADAVTDPRDAARSSGTASHRRPERSASGSGSTSASTSPRSPTRPTGSAGSSRSTRYDPDSHAAQAHRARPLQARGRQRPDRRRAATSVAYMGDDERFDYFYKFVSAERIEPGDSRAARKHNLTLLDEGTLYVAKLTGDARARSTARAAAPDGEFDGSGEWIPLASGTDVATSPGMTAEEVLVFTRLAGGQGRRDQDGPPRGHRAQPAHRHGLRRADQQHRPRVNDRARPRPDEANPRNANKHGHILELDRGLRRPRRDARSPGRCCWSAATRRTRAPTSAGSPRTRSARSRCPDNVAFDAHGNLWISTDGNELGATTACSAVPVAGPAARQAEAVPDRPDRRRDLRAGRRARRPARVGRRPAPGRDGGTFEKPASTWPGTHAFPRPGVVVTHRA